MPLPPACHSHEPLDVGQSSVHRAHFLHALVDLVPEGVANFGKRVETVEKTAQKLKQTQSLVVTCDGVKSQTRQILLGKDHEMTNPTFTGKYAYRVLIAMEKAVGALGEELASNSQMYLGRHGHVLKLPIEQPKTLNVVVFQTKKDEKWEDERWILPMKKEDMYRDFEGWGNNVQQLLPPDIWALFDHPPAPKGRFAILGDAAHVSTPHQGAGAGQVIEVAFGLSNLLGQIKTTNDTEIAFHTYDAVRRPRSQKVVKTSREAAALYNFEDEELGTDFRRLREG